jgi:hypothetical protein
LPACVLEIAGGNRQATHTLALLFEGTLGRMARLEALLALLGRAAVVMAGGTHVGSSAAARFESEGNRRRHFDCNASESLRSPWTSAGQNR